jgi:hypothetical protein
MTADNHSARFIAGDFTIGTAAGVSAGWRFVARLPPDLPAASVSCFTPQIYHCSGFFPLHVSIMEG